MSDKLPVQSHTSVDTFNTCPRQFEARYITKETKFEETDATRWGNLVHKAMEDYLLHGKPLPPNVPYTKYAQWVKSRPGTLYVERSFALFEDLTAADYWDKGAWVRSKIDVCIVRPCGTVAEVFDWKTGKMKMDMSQLLLYALMVMAAFPTVKEVRCGNIWMSTGTLPAPIGYFRMNMDALANAFRNKYDRVKSAFDIGVFVPKPSGLCNGWCQVTRCEHWKPMRKR